MTEIEVLALMGPAPPPANAEPSRDAVEETTGFAAVIATATAVADGGGGAQQPNASEHQPPIETLDLELILGRLFGEATPRLTQQQIVRVTRPDRNAEAGAEQALATTPVAVLAPGGLTLATAMTPSTVMERPAGAGAQQAPAPPAATAARWTAGAVVENGQSPEQGPWRPSGAQASALPPQTGIASTVLRPIGDDVAIAPLPSAAVAVDPPMRAPASGRRPHRPPSAWSGKAAPLPVPPSAATAGAVASPANPAAASARAVALPAKPAPQPAEAVASQPRSATVSAEAVASQPKPAPPPAEAVASQPRPATVSAEAVASQPKPATVSTEAVASPPQTPASSEMVVGTTAIAADGEGVLARGVAALGRAEPAMAAPPQIAQAVAVDEGRQLAARMADTVQRAVRLGAREFRVRLHPPELGQLNVRVVETADGVRVMVGASSREASDLIQQQLPLLRAALESRELRVGRLDVFRSDLSDTGDAGETGAGRRGLRDHGGDGPPVWSPLAAMEQDAEAETAQRPLRISPGGISAGETSKGNIDVMA